MDNFNFLLNKESGKNCLILGGASSIHDIQFEKFNGILISMGDIPERIKEKRQVDYWISANTIFPRPDKHFDRLNQFKSTTLIFSDSVLNSTVPIDYEIIKNNLKIPWFEYDQRHFKGLDCDKQLHEDNLVAPRNCCLYKKKITIQEFLQQEFNLKSHYSTGSTVAIHSLAVAIILGCKKIYLAGIELPKYEKDHTYYGDTSVFKLSYDFLLEIIRGERNIYLKKYLSIIFKLKRKSAFYSDLPIILKDFEYLSNLCNSNGIELFNLSPKSSLNKIHNLEYLDPSVFNKL